MDWGPSEYIQAGALGVAALGLIVTAIATITGALERRRERRYQRLESYRAALFGRQLDAGVAIITAANDFREEALTVNFGEGSRRMPTMAEKYTALLTAIRANSLTLSTDLIAALEEPANRMWSAAAEHAGAHGGRDDGLIDRNFDAIVRTVRDHLGINRLDADIRDMTGAKQQAEFRVALEAIGALQDAVDRYTRAQKTDRPRRIDGRIESP